MQLCKGSCKTKDVKFEQPVFFKTTIIKLKF